MLGRGLRTFSWRPGKRIIICSVPRNDGARWTCIPPRRRPRPGRPDQAVPGTLACGGSQVCRLYGETHHPTGDKDQGDRAGIGRHAAEAGRRTARRGHRSRPQLGHGVPARAAWPRCNPGTGTPRRTARPRPRRGETGMPGTATTTQRRCAAGSRNWSWRTR